MFCSNCGTEVNDDDFYCSNCGILLKDENEIEYLSEPVIEKKGKIFYNDWRSCYIFYYGCFIWYLQFP